MNGHLLLATEEIIDKYADMVYRLAVNEMGNREDAQDVFQEVFLRLVRYRDRITSEEHLKAWLLRVTINCARKQQTSAYRKKVHFLEQDNQEPDEKASEAFREVENADSPVTSAIASLPKHYRSVVHLYYYEELSIAEIGKVIGQKESAVKSRLFRAREMLRIRLKGEDVL